VRLRTLLAFAAAALLASCATPPFTPGPQLTLVAGDVLPPPEGTDPTTGERPFRIGPLDQLGISVFGLPELTQRVQVDSGGDVSLPLAGQLHVAGKTTSEVAHEIESRLRGAYVRNPQVSVNVDEIVSQVVTIDGEVREPGLYPVPGNMTLMRAIASAKGVSEFARLEDVVVFRTVGDRQMAALYNLQAIRRGNYGDPRIYAGDVVVVGNSPGRRLFRDILQASPLITTPIIALLNRS
jgi:polysaccharide export outer membrane protein